MGWGEKRETGSGDFHQLKKGSEENCRMMNEAAAETADSLIAYLHDIDGAAIKILASIIENLVAIAVK